jgi:uncharacterized lipoprotein YmbA
MTMKTRSAAFWMLAGLLGFAGCSVVPEPQADRTRYFVLSEPTAIPATPVANPLVLGLKHVTLPAYLDKGSIVVRRRGNEIAYNDLARWAEPLGAGLERLVRNHLLASPKVGRVLGEGFPFDQKRDYDIAITIGRCEGVRAGGNETARFAATVEITAPGDNGRVVARRSFGPVDTAWDGEDYGAVVEALSAAVGALGDDILAALPER